MNGLRKERVPLMKYQEHRIELDKFCESIPESLGFTITCRTDALKSEKTSTAEQKSGVWSRPALEGVEVRWSARRSGRGGEVVEVTPS